MQTYDLVNGAVLALGVGVAMLGPRHTRSAVLVMGGVLLLNWHQFATSWPEGNAVSALLYRAGIVAPAPDVWLAFDALSGAAGVYAWLYGRSWAGLAIYAAATAMVILHLLRWDIPAIADRVYYDGLEWLFRGQVLALYMTGGKRLAGVGRSFLSAGAGRLCNSHARSAHGSARVVD